MTMEQLAMRHAIPDEPVCDMIAWLMSRHWGYHG